MRVSRGVGLAIAPIIFLAAASSATAAAFVGGPVYPLPNNTGLVSMGGAIGLAGGETWSFAAATPTTQQSLWWGPAAGGVQLSFNNASFTGTGETLTYSSTLSNPSAGLVVYTGTTAFCCGGGTVYTRFQMMYTANGNSPLIDASGLGLSSSTVGEVLPLAATPAAFSVNLQFQASFTQNSGFQPALTFYNAQGTVHGAGGTEYSSFGGGYYVETPPQIGSLQPTSLLIQENATSSQVTFQVDDTETGASGVTVTASSDNQSVIADANIALSGAGTASRSVTVTSTSASGTANITLTASDGLETSTATLPVRVNAPPVYNGPSQSFVVAQGASGPITTPMLSGTDPDSSSPVTFLVEGQTFQGTLFLNGVANPTTFTQSDVDNSLLTYTNDGQCHDDNSSDGFEFEIEDVDGGFANDPSQGSGPTTYTFPISIQFAQTAPTANSSSLSVALGGSTSANLSASSTDCVSPAITYQLVTAPAHGNLTGPDANTGAFTYTANSGYSGSDSFTFTATTYGTLVSAPATVSITVQDQAPVAQAGSLVTHENDSATGTLSATDADLPPQTLTYAIATAPTKGVVTITNVNTGSYTYTPNHNIFGTDSFTFTASDGTLTSSPATVSVQIRPYLKTGEVVITDQGDHSTIATSVILFDPASGQQATFSQDPQFNMLQGVAVEADGHVLVGDSGNHSIFRLDPLTGAATLLVAPGTVNNATNLAVESNGDILVADPSKGVLRFDPTSGSQIGPILVLDANAAPSNVAVAADTTLWVTDVGAEFSHAADDRLWHVNADGSNPVVVAHGGNLTLPIGLALGADGDAYVTSAIALFGSGASTVVHVDSSGNQTIVSQDGDIDAPADVALASASQLYVVSNKDASIIGVDTGSGVQTPLAVGDPMVSPWAIEIVPPLPGVDLSVTISNALSYLPGGKTARFTVVVTNTANQTATAATIAATLPANLTSVGWTCQAAGGASCTASGSGQFSDTLTLPVGATATYVITVNVAKTPETTTTYSVTVTPASGITDIDTSNNTASDSEMVKIFADGFD